MSDNIVLGNGILIGPGVLIRSGNVEQDFETEDNILLITEDGNQFIEE